MKLYCKIGTLSAGIYRTRLRKPPKIGQTFEIFDTSSLYGGRSVSGGYWVRVTVDIIKDIFPNSKEKLYFCYLR